MRVFLDEASKKSREEVADIRNVADHQRARLEAACTRMTAWTRRFEEACASTATC